MDTPSNVIMRLKTDGFKIQELTRIAIDDICYPEDNTGYRAAKSRILLSGKRKSRDISQATKETLEHYLNAPCDGSPFRDYQPQIGLFLFPSRTTGRSLSRQEIHTIVAKHDMQPKKKTKHD